MYLTFFLILTVIDLHKHNLGKTSVATNSRFIPFADYSIIFYHPYPAYSCRTFLSCFVVDECTPFRPASTSSFQCVWCLSINYIFGIFVKYEMPLIHINRLAVKRIGGADIGVEHHLPTLQGKSVLKMRGRDTAVLFCHSIFHKPLVLKSRASNEGSRIFNNHGEGAMMPPPV